MMLDGEKVICGPLMFIVAEDVGSIDAHWAAFKKSPIL